MKASELKSGDFVDTGFIGADGHTVKVAILRVEPRGNTMRLSTPGGRVSLSKDAELEVIRDGS